MRFDAIAVIFALFAIILCVWLGIFGPVTEVRFEAKDWLGFAGNVFGGLATFAAALIAWHAVKRQIISTQLIADRNARPWVSLMASYAFSFTVGNFVGARIRMKNHGQSVAVDGTSRGHAFIGPWILPDGFQIPKGDSPWVPPTALFPGADVEFIAWGNAPVSSAQIDELRNRTATVYVFAEARYQGGRTITLVRIEADDVNLDRLTRAYAGEDLKITFGKILETAD